MQALRPVQPTTLVGFSAGGGFALGVAGGTRQTMFDNYLFMAPFTGRHAVNYRPDAGGWVSVGVPRIVALNWLNRAGLTLFNTLPVVNFAVDDAIASRAPEAQLTSWYAFALSKNFQPPEDYQTAIRNIHRPAIILVGQDDEVFIAEKFAQVFADAGRPDMPIHIVPGAGHVTLTLLPAACASAVAAVDGMNRVAKQDAQIKLCNRP